MHISVHVCMSASVCVCEAKQADGREMHAVLTAVGELHSLTDWQVSEASEEAELVDFWEREDGVKTVEWYTK